MFYLQPPKGEHYSLLALIRLSWDRTYLIAAVTRQFLLYAAQWLLNKTWMFLLPVLKRLLLKKNM